MRGYFLAVTTLLIMVLRSSAQSGCANNDRITCLTQPQSTAIKRIDQLTVGIKPSRHFKKIPPDTFVAQLKRRIEEPSSINQGKTKFCWIAAPLTFMYLNNPEGIAEAMFNLYTTGEFQYFNGQRYLSFAPNSRIRNAVGSDAFTEKSDLLSHQFVDQMAFMAFAGHYKCWLNVDRRYDAGDEDKVSWAAASLRKEVRVWEDLGYHVEKRGSNLIWHAADKAGIVKAALDQSQAVVLFVNSAYFNKKWDKVAAMRRTFPFFRTGSHYVLVYKMEKANEGYNITYWDDDGGQQIFLEDHMCQKAVFGIAAISTDNAKLSTKL